MKFPKIPKEYFRHFVSGIFDGDGTVYLDKLTLRVKLLSGSNIFIQTLNILMAKNNFPLRKIDISYRYIKMKLNFQFHMIFVTVLNLL